jgi:GNAT superfamily N-acetyltransferase
MRFDGPWSDVLLSRVEDAGLNASAPPQQRWIDGWLVRTSPGKAKRARCVQPVADGRLAVDERLDLCATLFREAGLPLFLRITPFARPQGLDAVLEARDMHRIDDTRVMVSTEIPAGAAPLPARYAMERLAPADFAEQVGALRGSPASQRAAHAERLAQSPVPYEGWVLRRREDGVVAACGQVASEASLVGIYDVFTDPAERGRGLAGVLCRNLLAMARARGAAVAYLQVDAANDAARAVYRRLGFSDAYGYHYRSPEADAH